MAKLQRLSHKYWGTSQPIFKGSGVFTDSGLLPYRAPITTVVGAPIPVTQMDPKQVSFSSSLPLQHRSRAKHDIGGLLGDN